MNVDHILFWITDAAAIGNERHTVGVLERAHIVGEDGRAHDVVQIGRKAGSTGVDGGRVAEEVKVPVGGVHEARIGGRTGVAALIEAARASQCSAGDPESPTRVPPRNAVVDLTVSIRL